MKHFFKDTKSQIYLFFAATYFAQGMLGIAYEPISYLLKDFLELSATESAVFVSFMTAPFIIKPLFGALSDAFPINLFRRRPYLLASSALTTLGWLLLAYTRDYTYGWALFLLTGVNVGLSFSDVLCDGVMVERGKKENATGKYQAAQIGTLYITLLATGVGGGWLAENLSYQGIFLLTAFFPLLIFAASLILPDEPVPAKEPTARIAAQRIGTLLQSASFWAIVFLIILFNFSPFKGTSWFYYQTDSLGFSKLFIGTLTSIGGVAGVLGASVFWKFYNQEKIFLGRSILLNTETLVRISVILGVPTSLLFLLYRGTVSAALITALSGAIGVILRLSLMDLAAKACPKHGEATAFALFMSAFNLSAWASNLTGAQLFEYGLDAGHSAYLSMSGLILLGTACIAACWFLLPAALRSQTRTLSANG